MYLKKHLNFIGDRNKSEFSCHIPGSLDSDMIVELDDFDRVWSFLEIISKDDNENDLIEWKDRYQVKPEELEEIENFLIDNDLVYTNEQRYDEENPRRLNFLNNIIGGPNRYTIEQLIDSKQILIIGLGTVGTAVLRLLLGMGFKRFILIDGDRVEKKNLMHQFYFDKRDIGRKKVEVIIEKIKELSNEVSINIYDEYINTFQDLKPIIKEYRIDCIFCAFDNYSLELLSQLEEYTSKNKIPTYISGYNVGKTVAKKLDKEVVNESKPLLNENIKTIFSNSGVGFLGDLAAILMFRLWMEELVGILNHHTKKLEIDFFSLSNITEKNIKINEILNYDNIYDNALVNKEIKENIIMPRILNYYLEYIKFGDPKIFEIIKKYNDQFKLELFENEELEQQRYMNQLSQFKITYQDKEYNIMEFSKLILTVSDIPTEIIDAYLHQQVKLFPQAIEIIKHKKEKYYSDYQIIWNEKSNFIRLMKKCMLEFSKIHLNYTIDYNEYKLIQNKGEIEDIDIVLNSLKKIDTKVIGYDLSGYIDYCKSHNYLHVGPTIKNTLCLYNPRYNSVNISIPFSYSWDNAISIAHEIGQGYFYSFISSREKHKLGALVNKTFAFINEFLFEFTILETGINRKAIVDSIVYKLQNVIVRLFSLDLYEQRILNLDEITLENIVEGRNQLITESFPNFKIMNDKFSRYNLVINLDMLFEKRDVCLYPEALVYGFYIAKEVYSTDDAFSRFTSWLRKKPIEDITISNLLSQVFGVTLNTEFYEIIIGEIIDYAKILKNISSECSTV